MHSSEAVAYSYTYNFSTSSTSARSRSKILVHVHGSNPYSLSCSPCRLRKSSPLPPDLPFSLSATVLRIVENLIRAGWRAGSWSPERRTIHQAASSSRVAPSAVVLSSCSDGIIELGLFTCSFTSRRSCRYAAFPLLLSSWGSA